MLRRPRRVAVLAVLAVVGAFVGPLPATLSLPASAAQGPVGNGFTVTPADLNFILKQIKISERHAATLTAGNPCGTLVAQPGDGIPDTEQIPDRITSYGLRTTDGSCNNLFPGRETFAAADQPFPRLTTPKFRSADPDVFTGAPTTYASKNQDVTDSQPRVVSNLVVDQTSTNPAAVEAAAHPVRTQGNPGVFACGVDGAPPPPDCVEPGKTLSIPNVTTDVGLSPPYSSIFTFFGQFFDHGVDQTLKSHGSVFIPLKADDPLVTSGRAPAGARFMVLTRTQNQPGKDGVLGTSDDVKDATNTDSPWADQSQTYASHSSHQVFLREYEMVGATAASPGHPVSTGRMLGGLPAGQTYPGSPDGQTGMATWASVKRQARTKLGIELTDLDIVDVPMVATDPYGQFIPGPARGLPQLVEKDPASGEITLREGSIDAPITVDADTVHFDTPFVTDIAHNADPSARFDSDNDHVPDKLPSPDADQVADADFTKQPAGTYDDELLAAHFCAGDGRVNENIALSAIHQIFHSEHDRLVADIQRTLDAPGNEELKAAYQDTHPLSPDDNVRTWTYGDRLFQAARFVTEMEYQHLVFEEFARKVQPAIRPFHVYHPDIDAAVQAEFAHAVYRFGHSMLDDEVARLTPDATGALKQNDVPLLTAFLNPPEYFRGLDGATLSPEQAAGQIFMGSSDQAGNEIDEFVTETLRNNLLGLPLDLPSINMARARDAGVPPLNDLRRQIFAKTNDGQLAPYTSWADFGQHLKHPMSLVNFVAAYGTHPTITGATTLAAKRAAAQAIVDPLLNGTPGTVATPPDASDFLFSTGAWASGADGVTTTGLDDVDLWVGGLAEITNLFGGLLGSTFNYVFETQLESLQEGDRFYYLGRTPGMNLRAQLEGNSFAEMIQRNTDGTHSLKGDVFATADCKFQLADIVSPYDGSLTASQLATPAIAPLTGAGTVNDDPATTDCDENQLLMKKPDGTVQYRQFNNIDPSGINGQAVYNGTGDTDRIFGGNDNDTFWGGDARDWIEGNGGDDVTLAGNGDDILTDLAGADVQEGGPGDDAMDAGIGDDITIGGDGQDLINGGANDNETFAGEGDDFIISGQGADAIFGDGGDDWIEGGTGQDLLQGDHGAPFFDDPGQTKPGNDVFVGQVGENDYDGEGGDDIMSQNAAIDRNAGAGGWDWAIHQYDTVGADDDLEINQLLPGLPIQVVVNRDRWQETESVSGSRFDDVIRGDDQIPSQVGGAGFSGCDALDADGVARISGLAAIVPPLTVPVSTVTATSAAGFCPLHGNVWGQGNILLGAGGSDTLEGRGGDDVLDGDRMLMVRISVRTDPADPSTEIGSTDLLESTFQPGNPRTLQQAVFDGSIRASQLVPVREISIPADQGTGAVDTAVFSGPSDNYDVALSATGVVTVTQVGPDVVGQKAPDGTDTLRNVERLRFTDRVVDVATLAPGQGGPPPPPPPGGLGTPTAPTITGAVVGNGQVTVQFAAPASDGGSPLTELRLQVFQAGVQVDTESGIDPTATSRTVTGLTNGTPVSFRLVALNAVGQSLPSAPTGPLTPATVPGPPSVIGVVAGQGSATVRWAPPGDDGGSPITSYEIVVARTGGAPTRTVTGILPGATERVVDGLTAGAAYTFLVRAMNARGGSTLSDTSDLVVIPTSQTAPTAGPGAGPLPQVSPPSGPVPDSVAPRLTSRTPGPGTVRVRRGSDVVIVLSEPVLGLRGRTFRLSTTTGDRVAATVTVGADGRSARLDPHHRLARDTRYRVILTGGPRAVRDAAGNPLLSKAWRFTTRG